MPMLRVRTAPHPEVPLLDAGRAPDLYAERKSVPWPFDHRRERDA